ncbi:hypothetical protein [Roseixanthobacter glucoisosaccharinicivorans]|uniref:hypothetical protein n=1 Tax=Roseixanthobacter glucoisosaccharinicivorans TaxID=3119923 RepID=UPI0037272012
MDTNYGWVCLSALLIVVLLLVPGLWWNARAPAARRLPSAFVPVPGLLALAATGLLLWIVHPASSLMVTLLYGGATLLLALDLAWRWWRADRWRASFGDQGPGVFALWGAMIAMAMAVGLNPLPIAQESHLETVIPGRMVASPPDHLIPYITASYMFHGKNGIERSKEYFGEWSVAARGPLVPLATNALFSLFGATPRDTPNLERKPWPGTSDGAYLSRLLGWITNAMIVLGAGHLLLALGVKPASRPWVLGCLWVALAPAMLINTVFLWPKVLAGFFILLALAALLRSRWGVAAGCGVLAWLSHPVGLLFLPPLGLIALWTACDGAGSTREKASAAVRAGLTFGLVAAFLMTPWLAYKAWLGAHDMFMDYMLSDGRGLLRAASLWSWLGARWDNFWITLSPTTFYYSSNLHQWVDGPVSDPLRWTVQYAKTLPSGLGMSLFLFAYLALLRPSADPRIRRVLALIVLTFALMLLLLGFSRDGLGRNSLEPLVPLIIVLCAAQTKAGPAWMIGLAGIYLEGRWVEFTGFMLEKSFSWANVPLDAWVCWSISSLVGLALLSLGYVVLVRGTDLTARLGPAPA